MTVGGRYWRSVRCDVNRASGLVVPMVAQQFQWRMGQQQIFVYGTPFVIRRVRSFAIDANWGCFRLLWAVLWLVHSIALDSLWFLVTNNCRVIVILTPGTLNNSSAWFWSFYFNNCMIEPI